MADSTLIHASCVDCDGAGLLITGASGSGKTSLVIALLERGATLVADDQVLLSLQEGRVLASAPKPLLGVLELYGFGVIRLDSACPQTPLMLAVELCDTYAERLPDAQSAAIYCGQPVQQIQVDAKDPQLATKISMYMNALQSGSGVDALSVASNRNCA